ncbi:hypothetical protein RGQ15_07425 [Paracoccus sp. MBLB3053]|uniref:Flap endonuclease-1-like 5' DNA nuclease n=1 Tax=Paracoccus aurantius TaxID=3073814 RepID=A0ABU2HRL0_9RHOB|nr:hypothetical protein [Paracoccus sp. MBLB3053]MDS9467402.1 hypothetical protein [Paracoccus sp. MBLB3053]
MERSVCNRNCWILGAIAGVVVLLFTSGIGELGLAGGLFLGLITFALFGALMVWLVCGTRPDLFEGDDGMTGLDWEREAVEHQPTAMLVSASLGPEPVTSATQMPIMAGAMPAPRPTPAPVTASELQPDDLRRIKGVGEKLSVWLNENGVTRFDQIAAWDDAAVAEFAHRLGRMGGRIEADDWVGQARLLARGGETEHSRLVDRGEST